MTGPLGALAILHGQFRLFCRATFLGGLYGARARPRDVDEFPEPSL